MVLSATLTEAPMRGSPFSSTTVPVTVLWSCANTETGIRKIESRMPNSQFLISEALFVDLIKNGIMIGLFNFRDMVCNLLKQSFSPKKYLLDYGRKII